MSTRDLWRERLTPRPWMFLIPAGVGAMAGVAMTRITSTSGSWLTGVVIALLCAAGVMLSRGTVAVSPDGVRAGRATLPTQHVGRVAPLDADETRRVRGPMADPRAWLYLRPLSTSTSVVIQVVDPEDPHPYWLVSTKDPEGLCDALVAARESSGPPEPEDRVETEASDRIHDQKDSS